MTQPIDQRWMKVAEDLLPCSGYPICHALLLNQPHEETCQIVKVAIALQEHYRAGCSAGWENALEEARDGHIDGVSPC